jgi:hypothetical protein
VIVIGFVAPLDEQRRAQRVQLLRRLFLHVAGPAAMAAATSAKATQQLSSTREQVAAAVKTAEAAAAAATAAWEEVAAARAEADAGYCPVPAPSASVTTSSSASLSLRTGSLQRVASIKSTLTRAFSSALLLSSAVATTLWGAKDAKEQAATEQAATLQAVALLASTAGVTSLQRVLLDFSRRYLPGLEEEQRKRTERTRQARRRMNATLRECGAAMDRAEAAQASTILRLSLRMSLLRSDSWRTRTYDEGIWPASWSELETHA